MGSEPFYATPAWQQYALCKFLGTSLFFPEGRGQLTRPRAICHACPVQTECLEYAFSTEDPHHRQGIWGGTTPTQRRKLHRQRVTASD